MPAPNERHRHPGVTALPSHSRNDPFRQLRLFFPFEAPIERPPVTDE